jgi:hypothetical protein
VLGDQEVTLTGAEPMVLHGVPYFDITVVLSQGSTVTARLGAESVPPHLRVGETLVATMAANMVVALSRPDQD